MTARYAIYYAPPAASPLWQAGCRWLGRDPESGRTYEPPALGGLAPDRVAAITASPRHYGLHATLKPPMALAEGRTEAELLEAVAAFAADRVPFEAPPLALRALGGFLALVPDGDSPELQGLADDCVRVFDRFRAPPTPAELARRQANGLSRRQAELLERWGYPYVFEEFRFHITLTGQLAEPERGQIRAALEPWAADFEMRLLVVSEIAIFKQNQQDEAFRLLVRSPFQGGL